MEIPAAQSYRTGLVTSRDGRKISYRQMGNGPGLILVRGGMQAAQNFMKLGAALADSLLIPLTRLAIHADGKRVNAEDASLESLIRSIHFDLCSVAQMAGTLEAFRGVNAEVLLLGGTKSVASLTAALDDHLAADDVGQPERVAKELRPFFAGTSISHPMWKFKRGTRVSGAAEFHHRALSEPDGSLSAHPAPSSRLLP
jgi:hypothetical protein